MANLNMRNRGFLNQDSEYSVYKKIGREEIFLSSSLAFSHLVLPLIAPGYPTTMSNRPPTKLGIDRNAFIEGQAIFRDTLASRFQFNRYTISRGLLAAVAIPVCAYLMIDNSLV